jgi:hypothetical protein
MTQRNRDGEGSTSPIDFESTCKESTINKDNPGEIRGQITSSQFHEFVTTVMQAITAELTKLTSTIESLKSEIKRDHEELIKNLTYKFETAQEKCKEDFGNKLNAEILIVSEETGNVWKENERD